MWKRALGLWIGLGDCSCGLQGFLSSQQSIQVNSNHQGICPVCCEQIHWGGGTLDRTWGLATYSEFFTSASCQAHEFLGEDSDSCTGHPHKAVKRGKERTLGLGWEVGMGGGEQTWVKEKSWGRGGGLEYAVVVKSLSSLNSFKINIKRQVIFSPNLLVELIIKCRPPASPE